ncbi:tripartite tricarboxylate transporter TctB family protein [Falsirhodobacter deserti]|uniref:tripartite tricarboxylate transporter TctB family protein n=1 Tax=Falsirhodobacter deserti TaxID=1365611 RepID=UPI0013E39A49|nr:tripartite tricarboxylate transporter TctB family protein [Falsirhodobacter deserti]
MQISRDIATGTVLIVAGAAMFVGARGFMLPAGLDYGAGFFPKIVSCGMAVSGLLILVGELRSRSSEPLTIVWRALRRIAALIGMIVLYGLAFDPIGFHISTVALLFAVTLFFGGSIAAAAILSVSATLMLHVCFYSVMKVALPWGLLLPFAW